MERIAIIGLGLIGGSLGLAIKRAWGSGVEIAGYSRRRESAQRARELGAVDRVEEELGASVKGAELVVIATPVMAMKGVLEGIAPHLSPGAMVTDTGSTKAQVIRWARDILPPGVAFIGGHPMAGKEASGIEAADGELFWVCHYCLVPSPSASAKAVEELVGLVKAIGARPVFLDPEEHDELVAGISHLPLLLSCALMAMAAGSPLWDRMSPLAATGFRDLTRLASGSPEMGRDIFITNRKAVVDWLDRYVAELGRYRRLIGGGGEELFQELSRVKEARDEWLRQWQEGPKRSSVKGDG